VLIFRDGVASWLKKSIRYQPIKGLPFTRFQIIRGPFRAPSTHEIAEDSEFIAADCEGFCHQLHLKEVRLDNFKPLTCQGSAADHNTRNGDR
jgi:hypothetical protein